MIPVNAVAPWLMTVKVTVVVPAGVTVSAANTFLILMAGGLICIAGIQLSVGNCVGNVPNEIEPRAGMVEAVQVTAAWLQSGALLANVPVPELELGPGPTVSGVLQLVSPGAMQTVGGTPEGSVGGHIPLFPANVVSAIVQDSVVSPELSVLVTVT